MRKKKKVYLEHKTKKVTNKFDFWPHELLSLCTKVNIQKKENEMIFNQFIL